MRGPSCLLALNIKKFEDVTSLISDILFLYQLTQARPHNVLHFLVSVLIVVTWFTLVLHVVLCPIPPHRGKASGDKSLIL